MKVHSFRPVCRASNRFSISALLYQNFLIPYHAAHHQRFSSSTSALRTVEPANNAPPSNTLRASEFAPHESTGHVDQSHNHSRAIAQPRLKYYVRKDGKSEIDPENQEESKTPIPSRENIRKFLSSESQRHIEELMEKAKLACKNGQEYEGEPLEPIKPDRYLYEDKWPWVAKSSQADKDPMSRLNKEIHEFYKYVKPSRRESLARKNLVEQVRADVRRRLPDRVLEVFGSERTGLSLALSDIDLRLVKQQDNTKSALPATPKNQKGLLRDLSKIRNQVFDCWKNPEATKYFAPSLLRLRYPLTSVKDRATGLDVQIVPADDTTKQQELIHGYLEEFPYLAQVYAVVKTMFDQRGLSDVYRGGFGSYPVFMMVVVSMQHQPNPRKDAASALLNFIYFWAKFKTRELGISVSPPSFFDKKESPLLSDFAKAKIADGTLKPQSDYKLSLRDPADETNDLGRKASAILHAQATLRSLLPEMIKILKEGGDQGCSLLAPLVGNVYARDLARRKRLALHGHWLQREAAKKASHEGNDDKAPALQQEEVGAQSSLPV